MKDEGPGKSKEVEGAPRIKPNSQKIRTVRRSAGCDFCEAKNVNRTTQHNDIKNTKSTSVTKTVQYGSSAWLSQSRNNSQCYDSSDILLQTEFTHYTVFVLLLQQQSVLI